MTPRRVPPAVSAPRYDHVQPGGTIVAGLSFGAFVCVVALAVALTGQGSRGPADRAAISLVVGAVLVVLVACAVVFRRLRAVVDDAGVLVAFGSGWPRRRIRTAEIRSARAVRNPWYYGWGIKLVPRGWMFNVSGSDAVEIELAGGRVFRIGTDDPAGLLAAVEDATGGSRR